ncbi:MAG: hypothetical protein AB1489_08845 [Acidobacteriota bacterium]
MPFYIFIIIIALLVTAGGLGWAVISLWYQLSHIRGELSQLHERLKTALPDSVIEQLKRLEKSFSELKEKEDQEFNTLWAEYESLRGELLAQVERSITLAQWQELLESRIPTFALIKSELRTLIDADAELGRQLSTALPAYLTSAEILPGLLDMARLPYERINWMEALILPVSARLDHNPNVPLQEPFDRLLGLLSYNSIVPVSGEIYRPEQHEVVEQRISSSPRGTILATRARGYSQQSNVLCKAKVVISAGQQ